MYQSVQELEEDYLLRLCRNFHFEFNDGRGDSFSFSLRFHVERDPYTYNFGGYQIGKSYGKFSKEGLTLYKKLNQLFVVDDIDVDLDQREMTDPLILWALFPKGNSIGNHSPLGFARLGWNWSDKKNSVNYLLVDE